MTLTEAKKYGKLLANKEISEAEYRLVEYVYNNTPDRAHIPAGPDGHMVLWEEALGNLKKRRDRRGLPPGYDGLTSRIIRIIARDGIMDFIRWVVMMHVDLSEVVRQDDLLKAETTYAHKKLWKRTSSVPRC